MVYCLEHFLCKRAIRNRSVSCPGLPWAQENPTGACRRSSCSGYVSTVKFNCDKITVWSFLVVSFKSLSILALFLFLSVGKWHCLFILVQASFFIAYVVTSGWTSISSELFRMFPLICSFISRLCCHNASDDLEVPSIPYHSEIPRVIFSVLLGITYFFLAPLILPFLLVYYCLGYIIYRNQVCGISLNSLFGTWKQNAWQRFIIKRLLVLF